MEFIMKYIKFQLTLLISCLLIFSYTFPCFAGSDSYIWSFGETTVETNSDTTDENETTTNNENFLSFQWKAPDTIEYSAKYVIDKKKGYLIIYGDTGECIATWGNEISPKDLEAFVSDTEYFLSKTILSTDTYTYYQEDIEKDFREWKEKIEKNDSRFLNSDDEDILYALLDCEGDLSKMSDYDVALVEKYYGYLDPELENVGKRISKRVYLWSVGYQMAAAQLGIAQGRQED